MSACVHASTWASLLTFSPQDLETRIAILSRRAQADKLDVPPQVLDYIASRISANIRELEGALIRVTAYASINKLPVDLPVAEMVLKDLVPTRTPAISRLR